MYQNRDSKTIKENFVVFCYNIDETHMKNKYENKFGYVEYIKHDYEQVYNKMIYYPFKYLGAKSVDHYMKIILNTLLMT